MAADMDLTRRVARALDKAGNVMLSREALEKFVGDIIEANVSEDLNLQATAIILAMNFHLEPEDKTNG